jgi:hypothetical protein
MKKFRYTEEQIAFGLRLKALVDAQLVALDRNTEEAKAV